jgi:predicted DCC family thiol-disulfide oxidoreductase YuxK
MSHPRGIDSHIIVYDGDCAFCTHWVKRLQNWLPVFPTATASQQLALDSLGLSLQDVTDYAWYITPTHHYAGHLAASALLRIQPRWWLRFLGHLIATPPFSVLASVSYRLVAKNRGKLPGGTPRCDVTATS